MLFLTVIILTNHRPELESGSNSVIASFNIQWGIFFVPNLSFPFHNRANLFCQSAHSGGILVPFPLAHMHYMLLIATINPGLFPIKNGLSGILDAQEMFACS